VKARDLFGLAVRIAGLVFLTLALFDGIYVLAPYVGAPLQSARPAGATAYAALCYTVIGFLLIVLARPIAWLSYLFET
jgi:hypothetical protein